MFLTEFESNLSEMYLRDGFIIRESADLKATERIRSGMTGIIRHILKSAGNVPNGISDGDLLSNIHKYVTIDNLNQFRLQVIQGLNNLPNLRRDYFDMARSYLEALVGSELAMQLRVNLSIQLPGDVSSLLPVHADTWSGDSPYEIVVWVPLVDCYRTKSMYILKPDKTQILKNNFGSKSGKNSEELYQSISKDVEFLEIKYGQVLLFDQGLPHGNRVNEEAQSRWSMNCRFKGVFTPYGDKKIGEFFEPITLRAASKVGMSYKFPNLS